MDKQQADQLPVVKKRAAKIIKNAAEIHAVLQANASSIAKDSRVVQVEKFGVKQKIPTMRHHANSLKNVLIKKL